MTTTLHTLKSRLAASSAWLDERIPTIYGFRTLPAVLVVIVYIIAMVGAVLGAQQGYEAQTLGDTIMYIAGDQVVTGGQTEPVGYEGSGFLYHILGVLLYASFHIALTVGTLMAMFTYVTSSLIPSAFWHYFFEGAPIPGVVLIAWAVAKDVQTAGRLVKTQIR